MSIPNVHIKHFDYFEIPEEGNYNFIAPIRILGKYIPPKSFIMIGKTKSVLFEEFNKGKIMDYLQYKNVLIYTSDLQIPDTCYNYVAIFTE